ncbi:MAG: HD domain-containing phosphohydrolase [Elusimicrobiota bacterium]
MDSFSDYQSLEFSAFRRISELINLSSNLSILCEKLLGYLMDFVRADGGLIILFDEDAEKLFYQFDKFHALTVDEVIFTNNLRAAIKQKLQEGVAGWVLRTSDCLTINDAAKEPKFKKEIFKIINYPVRNVIAVPLRFQGRSVGIIELFNKQPVNNSEKLDGFTNQDIQLLNSLSSLIAMIVENASLINSSDEYLAELNGLIRTTELINSALSLGAVLDLLMPLGMQMVNAEATSLLLMDEETGQLYFVAASGEKKEQVKRVYLRKGEGVAGWVAEHGEAVLIPDVSEDQRFTEKVDEKSGFVTKSILAVPLKLGEHLIGVLEAINKKGGDVFSSNDMRLLRSLAATGAFAIHKTQLFKDLNELFIGTIRVVADAIEAKDSYTRGHSERIRRYSVCIAKELNVSETDLRDLELAALLHDVGKIGIPEQILRKSEKLSDEDWKQIRKHPSIGADMLAPIKQLRRNVIPGIRYHQERYDGKGYPDGLAGEKIPLFARIIAVADTFDAMTSKRPYRDVFSNEATVDTIKKNSGIQFDARAVEAFIRAYQKNLIVQD